MLTSARSIIYKYHLQVHVEHNIMTWMEINIHYNNVTRWLQTSFTTLALVIPILYVIHQAYTSYLQGVMYITRHQIPRSLQLCFHPIRNVPFSKSTQICESTADLEEFITAIASRYAPKLLGWLLQRKRRPVSRLGKKAALPAWQSVKCKLPESIVALWSEKSAA